MNIKKTLTMTITTLMLTSPFALAQDREFNARVTTHQDGTMKNFLCASETIRNAIRSSWQASLSQSGIMAPEADMQSQNRNGRNGVTEGQRAASFSTVDPIERMRGFLDNIDSYVERAMAHQLVLVDREFALKRQLWDDVREELRSLRQDIISEMRISERNAYQELNEMREDYLRRVTSGLTPEQVQSIDLSPFTEGVASIFEATLARISEALGTQQFIDMANATGINDYATVQDNIVAQILTDFLVGDMARELMNGTTTANDTLEQQVNFLQRNCIERSGEFEFNADIDYHLDETGDVYAVEAKAGEININTFDGLLESAGNSVFAPISTSEVQGPWEDNDQDPFNDGWGDGWFDFNSNDNN